MGGTNRLISSHSFKAVSNPGNAVVLHELNWQRKQLWARELMRRLKLIREERQSDSKKEVN